MFCHNCGKQLSDGTKFCRYCGAPQDSVQGAPAPAAPPPVRPVQPQPAPRPVVNQKPAYGSNAPMEEVDDSVSVGLVILSIFIPLFGLIYWLVKAKTRPRCARICAIASLVSWGVAVLRLFA